MEASALRAPARATPLSLPAPLLRLRSDEQLVALFRAGNEAAFTAIHDRYRQRLFAYARQMLGGSRPDAEDALQDVFVRAYGALRADGRPLSLKAWLYRIAHNRCIDHLRRPRPVSDEGLPESGSSLHDPLEVAERREDLRRLVADVQRLPRQQRSVLLMREIDGLSYADLAEAADVTVPAVKSLLVRARMGLVEAREARDTACDEVRGDLCLSADRGVRASGLARRHLRDCAGCREFRAGLRTSRRELALLLPAGMGPLGALAQAVGLGGGGAAGAGGAGAAAVGGTAASGTAALSVTKVAAVVCSAAVVSAGGAVTVKERLAAPAQAAPATSAPLTPPAARTARPGVGDRQPRPLMPLPDPQVQEPIAAVEAETTPPLTEAVPATDVRPVADEVEEEEAAVGTGGALAPAEPDQEAGTTAPGEKVGKPVATETGTPAQAAPSGTDGPPATAPAQAAPGRG